MSPSHIRRQLDHEIICDPASFEHVDAARACWYESFQEQETAFARAQDRELLLRWVRREMRRRLTPAERRMVELYYFRALSTEQVARKQAVHKSTVSRSLRRAIHKLRAVARDSAGEDAPATAALRTMKGRNRG